MTTTDHTPGRRIQYLCDAQNLSRKELAMRLNVAPSQISRILNGETKSISSDLLIKLAKEFHVSADYLLGLEEKRTGTYSNASHEHSFSARRVPEYY